MEHDLRKRGTSLRGSVADERPATFACSVAMILFQKHQ